MLEIKNLNVDIKKIKILENLNIKINKFSSIIGRNGAGKTTLMRTIVGALKAKKGSILFNLSDQVTGGVSFGKKELLFIDLTQVQSHNMSHYGIGYMPEDRRLVPELTVKENILIPIWAVQNKSQGIELERVLTFIPELKKFLHRESFQLSGGQQKLVALARAMIIGKKLLLLDEPFEGVAPALADRLVDLIKSLSKLELTTLITESDETFSRKIKADIIKIERGRII